MAINTLAYAQLFQNQLDQLAEREALTGWMDANAGQVKYNGGSEVKIPKINMSGLGNYDRDGGFNRGSVNLEYETMKMTQDRGRKFILDSMDVDETNFVATAGSVMGEFQRTKVIPEIDAYRISALATSVIDAATASGKDEMLEYSYDPETSTDSPLKHFKMAVAKIRDNGYNGPLVCHATSTFKAILELEAAKNITKKDWTQGGLVTIVPAVDNVPIIETTSNRMVTAIKVLDGKTSGQEKGGFEKATSSKSINFFITAVTTPIAVSKQDKMRIFDPNTYQDADAWSLDYRRYHDLWIKDNQKKSIYLSIKEAKA